MASNWEVIKLNDFVNIKTGFPFKSKQYLEHGEGYKLLRGDNVIQGAFRWENVKLWSEDELTEKQKDYFLENGDVILAMDRPWIEAGLKTAQITNRDLPCLLVQRVARLQAKNSEDQDFLRYLISSYWFVEYLKLVQTGTAIPHISTKQILSYETKVPPLEERKKIGSLLRSLDDKIELNLQMNETLEAVAQALFKSWFVDFDPVIDNALAAGNPIPDEFFERAEQRKAIKKKENQELQNLFPDEFEFNEELGWIPTGWRAVRFADITEAKQGRYLARNKMTDFPDNEYIYPVWGGNEVRGFSEDFLFDSPVVVLTCRGSNCGLLKITEAKSWVTNSSFACTPKFGSAYFLYTYFSNDDFSRSISGSAQPQITYTALKNNLMKFPISEKVVENLSMRLEVLRSKQIFCQKQSEILAKLRDTLLPKLMSGEVRIPDAEALVEEV